MATKFNEVTQESSPALSDHVVGYRTAVTGGERRTLLSAVYALFKTSFDSVYAALSHTHAESDITNLVTDLSGKAPLSHSHVEGDVTGLTTALGLKADKANVLELDNTDVFTPTANYHPATKKYIDDQVIGAGSGDVVGPAGAVDSRIAAFDGVTGKLLKDGGNTIAEVLARANHTGSQSADTITDGTANKVFTAANSTKLGAIESGATADQSASEIETAYNSQVSAVSQVEAEAGVATTVRRWTAERVKQAIVALETPGDVWVSVPAAWNSAGGDGYVAADNTYFYKYTGSEWLRHRIEKQWS